MSTLTAPAPCKTGPPTVEVCHTALGNDTHARCGAEVGDEPACCLHGAPPCGRPPCPLCDLAGGAR